MRALANQVVVITGAAGGLGRALVAEFLAHQAIVIAASRHAADWPVHQNCRAVELDVTDSRAARATIEAIVAREGRLDCLINNAGLTADATSWQMTESQWDQVLDINLKGAFVCCRAAARPMAKQRDGHIINISSYAGRVGARGRSNYAAAKAGLIGLTQSLAAELGGRNVRANAILPGVLPTKMTEPLTPRQMTDFAAANALGRINAVDEVARFVAFLATTRNISGQVFQLDSRIARWT